MPYIENLTARQQKEVLAQRKELVNKFGHLEKADFDEDAFHKLMELSPEKLSPALIWSIKHGWLGGYLIQQLERGSYRVLVTADEWRIIRVRKGAIILRIGSKDMEQFKVLLDLQTRFQHEISLLSGKLKDKKNDLQNKKRSRRSKSRKNRSAEVSHNGASRTHS